MVTHVEYEGGRDERILGGEARILRATNEKCPICGHPTGDCTGDAGPPIRVLGPDLFPSLKHEEMFIVPENVYEDRPISSMTTTRILVAAKGTAIPVSKARELGIY